MLISRDMSNGVLSKQWQKVKRSKETLRKANDWTDVYSAVKNISECAAEDILDFGNITKSKVDMVYVKMGDPLITRGGSVYLDGLSMAAGVKSIFKNADIQYFTTSEYMEKNERSLGINFYNEGNIKKGIPYIITPVNYRGLNDIVATRKLRDAFEFDIDCFSHVATSEFGLSEVQTKLTDFKISGSMNFARLYKEYSPEYSMLINENKSGWDAYLGELAKQDYRVGIQTDIMNLKDTTAWDAEILKCVILFLLWIYNDDKYKRLRRGNDFIDKYWITAALLYYKNKLKMPLFFDFDERRDIILKGTKRESLWDNPPEVRTTKINIPIQVEQVLQNLDEGGHIRSGPIKGKKYMGYKLTDMGVQYTSDISVAVLDKEKLKDRLLSEYENIIGKESWDIIKELYT